jgi:hypothetical protein
MSMTVGRLTGTASLPVTEAVVLKVVDCILRLGGSLETVSARLESSRKLESGLKEPESIELLPSK